MRMHFFLFAMPLLSSCLLAQGVTPSASGGCGPAGVKFKVKTSDDTVAAHAPADPSKASLVFIEDQLQERPGHAPCPKCSTRVQLAVDGGWIAATNGFSHTEITVEPGDHHLCVVGSDHFFADGPLPSLLPLHVEAGKTYFLRARLSYFYGYNVEILDLAQINEDEGRYLASVSKTASFTK